MTPEEKALAAFDVARNRHLGIRWAPAASGWIIENPRGERVHPPGVRVHADPVDGLLAGEAAIAAGEARAANERAETVIASMQQASFYPQPYVVMVDDGNGGQVQQIRWRILKRDGSPTPIVDRTSVLDAMAAAAQAVAAGQQNPLR